MKSLLLLWKEACADAYACCCTGTTLDNGLNPAVEMQRDFDYLERRYEKEGLSFLTITLPAFGKALERCLEKGEVTRKDFSKFRKGSKKSALPAFLQGLLGLLFDRNTGRLVQNTSHRLHDDNFNCGQAGVVQAIRQLTLMFAKIRLDCTPERDERAIDRYLDCEREVKDWDRSGYPQLDTEFRRVFRLVYASALDPLEKEVFEGTLVPHHGPGSTADKLHGNAKWSQLEWTDRLEELFLFGENVLPSWRHYHVYQDVRFLEPGKERPVRIVLVPKTLETPRVIAVEPTCMQYMQQAVAVKLVENLERETFTMLNFTDQEASKLLARQGSDVKSRFATIDLRDASDRVSNELVRDLFARWPWISKALDATRSRSALLPDGRKVRLAKFASMGSALCFPVEAMVFLTAALVGVQRSLNRRLTIKDIRSLGGKVRVYGDDIIVPTEHVQCVVGALQDLGLVVNPNKTFWKGNFRESCGGEYYHGYDVGYVKLRSLLPPNRTDAKGIVSLVAFRNLLYIRGYWNAARFCDKWLEDLKIPMPIVTDNSPIKGRKSFLPFQEERTHPTLHKPLVRGIVVSTRAPHNSVDGWAALTKCLVLPFQEDEGHLERSGRPDTVGIKIRWASPC